MSYSVVGLRLPAKHLRGRWLPALGPNTAKPANGLRFRPGDSARAGIRFATPRRLLNHPESQKQDEGDNGQQDEQYPQVRHDPTRNVLGVR